jgi:hypothetical protein
MIAPPDGREQEITIAYSNGEQMGFELVSPDAWVGGPTSAYGIKRTSRDDRFIPEAELDAGTAEMGRALADMSPLEWRAAFYERSLKPTHDAKLPFAVGPAAPRHRIECRAAIGAAESAPAPVRR